MVFIGSICLITLLVQFDWSVTLFDGILGLSWSKEIVSFLKENTQGLIVFILMALYLEFFGIDGPTGEKNKRSANLEELLDRTTRHSPSQALLLSGLDGLFGASAANHIEKNVFRDMSVLRHFSLNILVKEDSEANYKIDVNWSYETDSKDFLVAMTTDPLCAEALLSTGLIAEVFVVEAMAEKVPATIQRYAESKGLNENTLENLEFKKLSTRKSNKVLASASLKNSTQPIHIFEAPNFHPNNNRRHDSCKIGIRYSTTQSSVYPYIFWMGDRIIELETIGIDLSNLPPQKYKNSKVHFFISALQYPANVSPQNGVWSFPLHTWLVPGQGILVVWPSESGNVEENGTKKQSV
ncbi:MAG: hypothetical protein AAGC95_16245 [Pseudomonadota bacterium]